LNKSPSLLALVRTPRGTLGPQTLNFPDVQIDASKVPYRIRRQAYRHLGKLVSLTRELEKFAIEFEDAKTGRRFVFHAEAPRVVKNKLFELLANHPAVSKLWIWEA
jgi:hypothetical protein